jgi:hypothetical protein
MLHTLTHAHHAQVDMETMSSRTQEGDHTGYAFSQNESTATVTQAQVIRRYNTNDDKPRGE